MKKSISLLAILAIVTAGATFWSCEEPEEQIDDNEEIVDPTGGNDSELPVVSLKCEGGATLNHEGLASITVSLSKAAEEDVTVTLAVGSAAEEGYTAASAASVDFDSQVVIAAGETSKEVTVAADLSKVDETQQIVISIASASGASIDPAAGTVYLSVPVNESAKLAGAEIWGIIGAFNEWSDDVPMTKISDDPETWVAENVSLGGEFKFRGNKEWGDYDLGGEEGAKAEAGGELNLVYKGRNLTIDEGSYTITLYPTLLKADFAEGASPYSVLDWTFVYNGLIWKEGYYSYGQIESVTVTDTDGSYYYPRLADLSTDDSIVAAIEADPESYFAELQEEIDYMIESDMEYYGDTLEEALYWTCYNEDNDGPEVLLYGLPAGQYEFAIFKVNDEGKLTNEYAVISISHDNDPETVYPFVEQASENPEWTAVYDGWEKEGKSFYIAGKAPGAKYVYCEWYYDDEIDEYYNGSTTTLVNAFGSEVADMVYYEYTPDLIGLAEVDADGNFEFVISTYSCESPFPVYIIGFDADGKVLAEYGLAEIETPEVEPIEWSERTDWAGNYDEDYPDAIVVSACDAEYYLVEIYASGSLDYYGLDYLGEDVVYWVNAYGVETCIEYGYAFDSVPGVYPFGNAYYGAKNGMEVYIFGIDENGSLTGEYHMEILTGIPAMELTLVPEWTVTLLGDSYWEEYNDEQYLMVDIEVSVPGIEYFYVEENTQDDLDYYYDGSIQGLLESYEGMVEFYNTLYGYTAADLFFTEDDPQTSMDVYNPGCESTIYIMEFDEDGKATGRYGATAVVMPDEPSDASSAPKARAAAKKKMKISVKQSDKAASRNTVPAKIGQKTTAGKNIPLKVHTYKSNENAKLYQHKAALKNPAKPHGNKIVHK